MITEERLKQIRLTREVVNRAFGGQGKPSATGRALNDLLDEVERLRGEIKKADEAGFQVSAALEWHRIALATAKKALKYYAESSHYPLPVEAVRHFEACRDMGRIARQTLKEIGDAK